MYYPGWKISHLSIGSGAIGPASMSRGEWIWGETRGVSMKPSPTTPEKRRTANALRKLPPEQRDAILEATAVQAAEDYQNDRQLTAFEAFGKEDLHVDSTNSEMR
jgi:hypothetical protein